MQKVHIVVGSVMGQAEAVAAAMAAELQQLGFKVRVNLAFNKGDWAQDELLLVCTSNTGMGNLPANIAPFYAHLVNDYPAIAGRRYGVVNLGDSSYPDFAQAGRTLDEALADLGAVRVGEPLVMDAVYTEDYPGDARAWARGWGAAL